jgi:hypothetical protein
VDAAHPKLPKPEWFDHCQGSLGFSGDFFAMSCLGLEEAAAQVSCLLEFACSSSWFFKSHRLD